MKICLALNSYQISKIEQKRKVLCFEISHLGQGTFFHLNGHFWKREKEI